MYTGYFFNSENVTVLISLFALAWFVVGVLVGGQLPRKQSQRRRAHASGKHRGNSRVELYVGNLSYNVSERDLMKAFESFGRVASVRIIKDKFNGKSKGFGFLEMTDRSESLSAIRAMNGVDMKGRRIVVNEAKSRARD